MAEFYKRGKVYWVDYHDASGQRQRKSLKTHSKSVARRRTTEIEAQVVRERLGLEAAPADSRASLEPHWVAFQEELVAADLSEQHVRETIKSVRGFLAEQRVASLSQITLERAEDWLRDVAKRKPARGHARDRARRVSARTVNKHRAHLRRFTSWLVKTRRLRADPLLALAPMPAGDARHARRALTEQEFRDLLNAAPAYRRLLYLWHGLTGLRRSETARTRWKDVDLDRALLRVRPSTAKNKKAAELPLHPELVAALQLYRGGKLDLGWYGRSPKVRASEFGPEDPVFPVTPGMRVFKDDLAAAGIPYETDEGFVDRHALRVTFATRLALTGAPLAVAQRLLRHSSPVLTATIYTRAGVSELGEAVAKL